MFWLAIAFDFVLATLRHVEFHLCFVFYFIPCLFVLIFTHFLTILNVSLTINSLRPSEAYMRQQTNHHWFR